MGYSNSHHDHHKSVIIGTFIAPFDPVADLNGVAAYLVDALNTTEGNIYYIADMRGLEISFSDLVVGLASAYATPGSPYSNPRVKAFTVATDDLIALGTKAVAEQAQYGKAAVKLYASVEDALKDVQTEIDKG